MEELSQQYSDLIKQLQSKIQTLADENRLLKQRMDEAGISYADIVNDNDETTAELYDLDQGARIKRFEVTDKVADWKGKEFVMIENGRIRIYPAGQEQMERFILAEKDEELKKAYCEMLEGCLAHPDQWDWYAMWMIEKMDGAHIGDLCFKGLKENGNPEIGYGILDEYQGQGYATEAVKLALKWAFGHPEVVAVEAESDPDNAASQRVMEKCGFLATGTIGEEGPRFIVYKGANRPVDGAGCPADIRSARTETECRCSAPTEVERRNNKQ